VALINTMIIKGIKPAIFVRGVMFVP